MSHASSTSETGDLVFCIFFISQWQVFSYAHATFHGSEEADDDVSQESEYAEAPCALYSSQGRGKKEKKKIVISEDVVAFVRKRFNSLQLLRSIDVYMMILLYKKPSTGPMLASFPCLQNIPSLRFLKNP